MILKVPGLPVLEVDTATAIYLRDEIDAHLPEAILRSLAFHPDRDDPETSEPLPAGVEGHPVSTTTRRFPDPGAYASGVVWVALDLDGAR